MKRHQWLAIMEEIDPRLLDVAARAWDGDMEARAHMARLAREAAELGEMWFYELVVAFLTSPAQRESA